MKDYRERGEIEFVADPMQVLQAFQNELVETLKHQPSKRGSYRRFMQDFRHGKISKFDLVTNIRNLLKDERELLLKFEYFVEGVYVTSSSEDYMDDDDGDVMEEGETRDDENGTRDDDHNEKTRVDEKSEEKIIDDEIEEGEIRDDVHNDKTSVDHCLKLQRAIDFVNRVNMIDSKAKRKGIYKSFLDVMMQFKRGGLSLYELNIKMNLLLCDHEDLIYDFYSFLLDSKLVGPNDLVFVPKTCKHREKKEEEKSTQDLDLSACEQVSHSYWLLPKENQSPVQNQVLNNQLISVGTISDEYDHTNRNPSDQMAFQCEDDMYESDMLFEYFEEAILITKKLLKGDMDLEEVPIRFFRLIERLYGDQGLEMTKAMESDVKAALHLMLPRFEQKKDELSERISNWKPFWKRFWLMRP